MSTIIICGLIATNLLSAWFIMRAQQATLEAQDEERRAHDRADHHSNRAFAAQARLEAIFSVWTVKQQTEIGMAIAAKEGR